MADLLSHCARDPQRPSWCSVHDQALTARNDPFLLDVYGKRVLVLGCAAGFEARSDEI